MDPWRDGRANGPSHLDFFGLQWRVSRVIFKLGRRATRTTRHHRAPAGPTRSVEWPHRGANTALKVGRCSTRISVHTRQGARGREVHPLQSPRRAGRASGPPPLTTVRAASATLPVRALPTFEMLFRATTRLQYGLLVKILTRCFWWLFYYFLERNLQAKDNVFEARPLSFPRTATRAGDARAVMDGLRGGSDIRTGRSEGVFRFELASSEGVFRLSSVFIC